MKATEAFNLTGKQVVSIRVELDVIDRLCGLFRCEVGELLEYVSDDSGEK